MLADTGYGTNWICFGSDPMNNKAKTIPFEYVHEWRWAGIEKMSNEFEEVRKIIKEHLNEADCGLFFCRNMARDTMTNIYNKNGIQIDICYYGKYFEVFGLDPLQQWVLEKYYDYLVASRYYDALK